MKIYNLFNFKEDQWYTTDDYDGASMSWLIKNKKVFVLTSYSDADIIIDLLANTCYTWLACGDKEFERHMSDNGILEEYLYFTKLDFNEADKKDLKYNAIYIENNEHRLIVDYWDSDLDNLELLEEVPFYQAPIDNIS